MSIGDYPVPAKLSWDQAERIIEHLNVLAAMVDEKSERLADQVRKDAEALAEALRVAKKADADHHEGVRNATTKEKDG